MRLLAVLACVAMMGCASSSAPGTKEVRMEPATAEGKACVKQCRSTQGDCRRQGQAAYRYCRQQYRQQEAYYKRCQAARAGFCTRPTACAAPNTSVCKTRFDDCFEYCGGAIESVPIELAPTDR